MIFFLICAVVLLFGLVVFVGAPYLPTMRRQSEQAIKMLDLPKGSTIIELGSGDGRVAKRLALAGYMVVGYELNPLLVVFSKLYTWRQRGKVQIIWGDFWGKQWPKAGGVYVFLLDKYMSKLDDKLIDYSKRHGSIRVISYTFKIPGKKPTEHKGGLYCYDYKDSLL